MLSGTTLAIRPSLVCRRRRLTTTTVPGISQICESLHIEMVIISVVIHVLVIVDVALLLV